MDGTTYFRLSRAVTMDDNYRLREFFHALAETKRSQRQQSPTNNNPTNTVGRGGNRLPAGREAREEHLLGLISQLESVETLARAMLALGGRRADGVGASDGKKSVSGAVPAGDNEGNALSASFHRRVCDLCRERAGKAATSAATAAAFDEEADSFTREPQEAVSASSRPPLPLGQRQEGDEKTAAIAALRFRANAHELYTLLQSVEVQPAGVAGEGEDGDPAFLPPGKRGWKHGLLCEEAAGWAEMTREGGEAAVPSRDTGSWSANLPDFQVLWGSAPGCVMCTTRTAFRLSGCCCSAVFRVVARMKRGIGGKCEMLPLASLVRSRRLQQSRRSVESGFVVGRL